MLKISPNIESEKNKNQKPQSFPAPAVSLPPEEKQPNSLGVWPLLPHNHSCLRGVWILSSLLLQISDLVSVKSVELALNFIVP